MGKKKLVSKPIRISTKLYSEAESISKIEHRSINKQIEYWAEMGKIANDNPDLPLGFIREILISKNEISRGNYSEYKFD